MNAPVKIPLVQFPPVELALPPGESPAESRAESSAHICRLATLAGEIILSYRFEPGPRHAELLDAAPASEPLTPSQRLFVAGVVEIYLRYRRSRATHEVALEQAMDFARRCAFLTTGERQ